MRQEIQEDRLVEEGLANNFSTMIGRHFMYGCIRIILLTIPLWAYQIPEET